MCKYTPKYDYQPDFAVCLRPVILRFCFESGTITLVIVEAPAVLGCARGVVLRQLLWFGLGMR